MKKRIFFLLLLLGVALCLFSAKSKDTVLALNFRSMLFSQTDPLGKKVLKTVRNHFVNYRAYNGKSLTLILADVNPFLYTVVINGEAHEYFEDQKKFEDRLEQALKESEKKADKTGAQLKESEDNAIDSIINNPDRRVKDQIQKNPTIKKSLETRNFNAFVEGFTTPETIKELGDQVKELFLLMNVSDLQKNIQRFHDDFNHLYIGVSDLKKNPYLDCSEIIAEFFNLVRSRFHDFPVDPEKKPTILDFQMFSQGKLAELKRGQDRIAKDYSDLLVVKPGFQEKMSGLEDSIEAVENIFQTFNECLLQFNAEGFMVRHVFPTIYGDEFVIRIKVLKKDSSEVVKELQPIRIHMANGTKIDFSAGIALGLNGADEEYFLEQSEENEGKQTIIKNSTKLVTPSPYALIHAYPRWLGRWIKLDFFCFGIGMNPNQTINYYVGTGFSGNTKRPIKQEDSNKIISDRRIVLNFGLVFTKIKTLAPRFKGLTEVDSSVKVVELLKESYKARLFVGISYNF